MRIALDEKKLKAQILKNEERKAKYLKYLLDDEK